MVGSVPRARHWDKLFQGEHGDSGNSGNPGEAGELENWRTGELENWRTGELDYLAPEALDHQGWLALSGSHSAPHTYQGFGWSGKSRKMD